MENVGAGEPFTAQRAYELGLVQRVAPLAEAEDAAHGWLSNAARARSAAAGRRSLYELAELPYELRWSQRCPGSWRSSRDPS